MNIRPATADDVRSLYSGTPHTMRAFVLENDGEILAVGGVAVKDGWNEVFSRVDAKAREIPGGRIALGRLMCRVRDLVWMSGCALALCDPNEPTAPALLEWAGFERQDNGVWRYG